MESLVAKIAFSKVKGINVSTGLRLLGLTGDADAFFTMPAGALSAVTGLDVRRCSDEVRQGLLDAARTEARFITGKSVTARFVTDEDFPQRLRECDDAPVMVYSTGKCSLDMPHSVAVVGTRHATPYGIDFVKHLVADLSARLDGLVVVSGLAYGIDVAAHRAAIENDVPTVAVVAHGLNTIYPADHRSIAAKIVNHGGAIVTEYSSDAPIHKGNFLARNRIVAGLADAVIVVESDVKGGAMSTARIASAYNREVFAAPGRTVDTYSRGCNQLIAEHTAAIVRSADDVIDALGWAAKPQLQEQKTLVFELTPDQQRIVDFIRMNPDHTVNDICVRLGMPYGQLSATLFEMEMNDMLTTLPGGRFCVKI